MMDRSNVGLVCLDIDGTLTDGILGEPLPGAVRAVQTLRDHFPVRLVTNATSQSHARLVERLVGQGLLDDPKALYTPAIAAYQSLTASGHTHGILLADKQVRRDFVWFEEDPFGSAVLLATEGHRFRIEDLQPAFRLLLAGGSLFTMQANRYYRSGCDLVTDLGPVAAFLEYASGVKGQTLGKPSALLFDLIAAEAGVERTRLVMVGDDAEFDVAGSVALGMAGVLVKTGKYRPDDEAAQTMTPTAVLPTIGDLPAWLGKS